MTKVFNSFNWIFYDLGRLYLLLAPQYRSNERRNLIYYNNVSYILFRIGSTYLSCQSSFSSCCFQSSI